MAKYKLTVAIPTYNRPRQLGHTLSVVLPQVLAHDDVQLIVLDNCSPVPAIDVLHDIAHGEELPGRIQVIRHVANIGGNGNILRCFEVAEGDWLWCLGDDDEPTKDAVDIILDDTDKGKYCYAFYHIFNNVPDVRGCDNERYVGSSLDGWISRIPSYGHRLFISTSVFRLDAVRPYLMTGYMVANSGGPHLVMALLAIMNGGSYLFSGKTICLYAPPVAGSGYNCAPLSYGSTSLILLAGNMCGHNEFKRFFTDALSTWVAPRRLLSDVISLHGQPSGRTASRYFSLIAAQFKPYLFEQPKSWMWWTICQMFSHAPKLFNSLTMFLQRRHKLLSTGVGK